MGQQKSWHPEEIDLLEELIEYYPIPLIAKKINKWHKKNNSRTKRSCNAVKVKLNRMGYSATPKEDNMSATDWSRQLKLSHYRVNDWVKRGGLSYQKIAHNKLAISIEQMTNFAREKPHLFTEVPEDILVYYFGGEVTAKVIDYKRKHPHPIGISRPVYRIDTGKQYKSLHEAEEETGISRQSLTREAKRSDGWLRFVGAK
jgi:hypothetical protein